MSTSSSRELIIERAAKNKPEPSALPDIHLFEKNDEGDLVTFSTVLKNIGGSIYLIHSLEELISIVKEKHAKGSRIYSPIREVQQALNQAPDNSTDGHELEDVALAIIKAHFAVAENGAVWVTDELMGNRTLPFICQHLAVIINERDIIATMHEAYLQASVNNYNYGTFIAGPSKTADIEQSLVLGAHGPKSMTVFVMVN
jgi:L-lactate dehydrogenase complex protein LldG